MIGVIFIVVFVIGIIVAISNRAAIPQLKNNYEQALRGKNKAAALNAGRAYYKALRGINKPLTVYDEQAIANDISTMDTN